MSAVLKLQSGREFKLFNEELVHFLENTDKNISNIEDCLSLHIKVNNIQNELQSLGNRIISHMNDSKNNTNSTQLGIIGEQNIQECLSAMNIPWKDNSKEPHRADIEINIKNSAILIDVKNYSKPVPTHEIDKLFRDCEENNIQYGILFSLKSPITKKVSFDIEYRNNVSILCVYVDTKHDIKTSINVISTLIDINNKNREQIINREIVQKCITNIHDKTRSITQLKSRLHSLTDYIDKWNKECLNIIHEYEIDIEVILNELKHECENEIIENTHDEIRNNFPYKQWIFVINDILKLDNIRLSSSPEMNKISFQSNELIVKLIFQTKKVNIHTIVHNCPCVFSIENIQEWNKLFNSVICI